MAGRITTRRRGNVINRDLIIKLSGVDGVGKFEVQDADGVPIWRVTSKGVVGQRGGKVRI